MGNYNSYNSKTDAIPEMSNTQQIIIDGVLKNYQTGSTKNIPIDIVKKIIAKYENINFENLLDAIVDDYALTKDLLPGEIQETHDVRSYEDDLRKKLTTYFEKQDITNMDILFDKLVTCDDNQLDRIILAIRYLRKSASLFGPTRAKSVTLFKNNYLVANIDRYATHVDPDLINPWGICCYQNQIWIVSNGTDSLCNYDLFGNKLLGTRTVRNVAHNSCSPTGICINTSNGFRISNGIETFSSSLLICTKNGTVHGFNPTKDPHNMYVLFNSQLNNHRAVYTGIAMTNNVLYLANFAQNKIECYDENFNRLENYQFIDSNQTNPIPADYSTVNVVNIGNYIYVAHSKRNPEIPIETIAGDGYGYISVFNLDGTFVMRFTSGVLNSPWAIIPAPVEAGIPPGSILVGNNGDGKINIFNHVGKYFGPLLSTTGLSNSVTGLRGLASFYNDFNEIFTASSSDPATLGLVTSIVKDKVICF